MQTEQFDMENISIGVPIKKIGTYPPKRKIWTTWDTAYTELPNINTMWCIGKTVDNLRIRNPHAFQVFKSISHFTHTLSLYHNPKFIQQKQYKNYESELYTTLKQQLSIPRRSYADIAASVYKIIDVLQQNPPKAYRNLVYTVGKPLHLNSLDIFNKPPEGMAFIYAMIPRHTNNVYIGSTKQEPFVRFLQHAYTTKTMTYAQTHNKWNKRGRTSLCQFFNKQIFIPVIIDVVPEPLRFQWETWRIYQSQRKYLCQY